MNDVYRCGFATRKINRILCGIIVQALESRHLAERSGQSDRMVIKLLLHAFDRHGRNVGGVQ